MTLYSSWLAVSYGQCGTVRSQLQWRRRWCIGYDWLRWLIAIVDVSDVVDNSGRVELLLLVVFRRIFQYRDITRWSTNILRKNWTILTSSVDVFDLRYSDNYIMLWTWQYIVCKYARALPRITGHTQISKHSHFCYYSFQDAHMNSHARTWTSYRNCLRTNTLSHSHYDTLSTPLSHQIHTHSYHFTALPHTERSPGLFVPHLDPRPDLLHTHPFGAPLETAGDDLSGHRCCWILPRTQGNLNWRNLLAQCRTAAFFTSLNCYLSSSITSSLFSSPLFSLPQSYRIVSGHQP